MELLAQNSPSCMLRKKSLGSTYAKESLYRCHNLINRQRPCALSHLPRQRPNLLLICHGNVRTFCALQARRFAPGPTPAATAYYTSIRALLPGRELTASQCVSVNTRAIAKG